MLTESSKPSKGSASVEWSAIQTLFEQASFDTLLLLDCCAAASAAPATGPAVTETIAACGFETWAPLPGRHSFTNALIEVLEDWKDGPPFSAAMLHTKVLSILKHERPEREQAHKRRRLELRRTPIHMVASCNPQLPSIQIARRPTVKPVQNVPKSPAPVTNSDDGSQPKLATPKRKEVEPEVVPEKTDGSCQTPYVIISLALEQNQS